MAKGRDPEAKKRANREAQRLFRARKHEELKGIKEKLIGREKELKLKEQELRARDRKIEWLLGGKRRCSPLRTSGLDILPQPHDIPSESTIVPSIEDFFEYESPTKSSGQGQADSSSSVVSSFEEVDLAPLLIPDLSSSTANEDHAMPSVNSEESKAHNSSSRSSYQDDLQVPAYNGDYLGTIDPATVTAVVKSPSPTCFDRHGLENMYDDWEPSIPEVQRPTISMIGTAGTSSTMSGDQSWSNPLQQDRCADQMANRDSQFGLYTTYGNNAVASGPPTQHGAYSADMMYLPAPQPDNLWQTLPVGFHRHNSDLFYTLKIFSDMLSCYCYERILAGNSNMLLDDVGLPLDRMCYPTTTFDDNNIYGLQPKGLSA